MAKIKISVLCFAQLKEFLPERVEIELKGGTSVDLACKSLIDKHSRISQEKARLLIDSCAFSVGGEFVNLDYCLSAEMELCLLPPPSGG